jgi:MazG family protein
MTGSSPERSRRETVPRLPPITPAERDAFATLLGLVRRLRAPDGCPWDRDQTLHTMTPYILEEAYEVIDAIDRKDASHLSEELGDLVFLLFFCAEIGREQSWFSIEGLLEHHVRKMVARHPHVFGEAGKLESGAAAKQWEEIKQSEGEGGRSVVDGRVPALPALTAAFRIQEKAAAVGFDWPETIGAVDKLEEEIAEFKKAVALATTGGSPAMGRARNGDSTGPTEAQREELGDLLFSLVNVSRKLRIDPEAALRGTVAKFIRRFRYIEARLAADGSRPSEASLADMDRLWEEAKAREAADRPQAGRPARD